MTHERARSHNESVIDTERLDGISSAKFRAVKSL